MQESLGVTRQFNRGQMQWIVGGVESILGQPSGHYGWIHIFHFERRASTLGAGLLLFAMNV